MSIIPTYGIFFAGCNLHCLFCEFGQYLEKPWRAKHTKINEVCSRIALRKGCFRTLSFIGGEPSLHLLSIAEILAYGDIGNSSIKVLNTNMYFSEQAREMLDEMIDVYVADVHFGNDRCAYTLSGAVDYCSRVIANIRWALDRGKHIILRHLLLPGHIDCCFNRVLDYYNELQGARFSLLTNYHPCHRSNINATINRSLSEDESKRAEQLLQERGISSEDEADENFKTEQYPGEEFQELIIDSEGRIKIPFVTKEMFLLAEELVPEDKELKKRKKVFGL